MSPSGSHHSLLFDQGFQKIAGWDWSERHLTVIRTIFDDIFHWSNCCLVAEWLKNTIPKFLWDSSVNSQNVFLKMWNQNGLTVWTCLEKCVPTFPMGTWHFIFKLGTLRIEIGLFMNCYWTETIGKINRFVEIKKMPLTHSFFLELKRLV